MPKVTKSGLSVSYDEDWNADVVEDLEAPAYEQLKLYSRDWTFETIASQIKQGNIDLDPDFQRKNVWTDERRSKLIESLIIGIPVPQIFLAEDPQKKRSFIVIDGKQRLISIAGFVDPALKHWDDPRLSKLRIRSDLNGRTFDEIKTDPDFDRDLRLLENADIRCAIIANYEKDDILYHIFNRLNTTSVPLSTQELRQVLHRGRFAKFLGAFTNQTIPLQLVLGLDGPDKRLRDAEIVLRFLGFHLFANKYKGNLKTFLDETMDTLNKNWEAYEGRTNKALNEFNNSVSALTEIIGAGRVGRKVTDGEWEGRFNKALFEVEAYYFTKLPKKVTAEQKLRYARGFAKLCDENIAFRESIEATTKTVDRYKVRFQEFEKLFNKSFGTSVHLKPFG